MTKLFDENKVSGVWLQIDTYDFNDNCIVKQFEVPKGWLQKQVEKEYGTIENFLDEYTSEDSQPIYEKAILEDMVLFETESK